MCLRVCGRLASSVIFMDEGKQRGLKHIAERLRVNNNKWESFMMGMFFSPFCLALSSRFTRDVRSIFYVFS